MGYLSCAYKDVQHGAQQKLTIVISRQKDSAFLYLLSHLKMSMCFESLNKNILKSVNKGTVWGPVDP